LLATHMSYPEIAAELSVSINTIKSQAYSLFRKIGASSRSQAVARSRELALLEGQDTGTGASPASARGRLWPGWPWFDPGAPGAITPGE
jgi:regulatory LuxR family protein